jgi:hypothetical protein
MKVTVDDKIVAQRAITLKKDQPEGPLHSEKDQPEGPLH